MPLLLSSLVAALLLGGWTGAWLLWSFQGDVRAWLCAAFMPNRWRAGTPRRDIANMAPRVLDSWLIVNCSVPPLFAQLVTCRFCWSAHVAAVGVLLLLLVAPQLWLAAPLIWAAAAVIGNIAYVRAK